MISKLLQELITLRIFYYSCFTINVFNKIKYAKNIQNKVLFNLKNVIIECEEFLMELQN
jgi:hypothetical protein